MSQTTGEEMLNRINATLGVLQDAQEKAVEAVRDVATHKADPDAHGEIIAAAVEAAVNEALGGASGGGGEDGEDGGAGDGQLAAAALLPGTIVAFAGTFGGEGERHPIPLGGSDPDTGWVLCDGGSDGKGGTVPNLLGRMILGVSDAYPAGSSGGTATHTHPLSGSVGATTLTVAQMPGHTHSPGGVVVNATGGGFPNNPGSPSGHAQALSATGGSQSHTHTLSGASGQASTLPPYYALAYIMRVA